MLDVFIQDDVVLNGVFFGVVEGWEIGRELLPLLHLSDLTSESGQVEGEGSSPAPQPLFVEIFAVEVVAIHGHYQRFGQGFVDSLCKIGLARSGDTGQSDQIGLFGVDEIEQVGQYILLHLNPINKMVNAICVN